NGSFVALGPYLINSGSGITISPDGVNWTARPSGYFNFGAATWGSQGFVAPSEEFWHGLGNSYSTIATSPDGTTWTSHRIDAYTTSLAGNTPSIAFGNGFYVFLSDPGTVRRSTAVDARAQPILQGGTFNSSGFELLATAQPGFTYTVQRSPSLSTPVW